MLQGRNRHLMVPDGKGFVVIIGGERNPKEIIAAGGIQQSHTSFMEVISPYSGQCTAGCAYTIKDNSTGNLCCIVIDSQVVISGGKQQLYQKYLVELLPRYFEDAHPEQTQNVGYISAFTAHPEQTQNVGYISAFTLFDNESVDKTRCPMSKELYCEENIFGLVHIDKQILVVSKYCVELWDEKVNKGPPATAHEALLWHPKTLQNYKPPNNSCAVVLSADGQDVLLLGGWSEDSSKEPNYVYRAAVSDILADTEPGWQAVDVPWALGPCEYYRYDVAELVI